MATDISKSSKEQLFNLVIQNNPAAEGSVPFNKIDFTTPVFLDSEIGLTESTIFALPNTGLNGSVVLEYTKLALTDLLAIEPTAEINVPRESVFSDVVAAFNALYGTNLSSDDYIDQPNLPEIDDEGFQVNLTATSTSFAYYGSLSLTVKLLSFPISSFITNTDIGQLRLNNIVNLANEITTTDLSGFNYGVSGVPSVWVGAQYTYGLDLTAYYSTLQPLTQGTVLSTTQGTSLDTALTYADLDGSNRSDWKSSTGTTGGNLTWNLQGATVVYNGLNDDATRPVNPKFKYVLVLQLRADQTAPLGNIYLGYNQPIDPLDVNNPND